MVYSLSCYIMIYLRCISDHILKATHVCNIARDCSLLVYCSTQMSILCLLWTCACCPHLPLTYFRCVTCLFAFFFVAAFFLVIPLMVPSLTRAGRTPFM